MVSNENDNSDKQVGPGLLCRKCNYDLVGLIVGDYCPECDTKVIVHAPSCGTERFTVNKVGSTAFMFLALAVLVMFGWPFFAYYSGISAILMLVMWPVITALPLSVVYFSSITYRNTAVAFDWKEETVSFERCYRSYSHYLSMVRKKFHTCSFVDILTIEEVYGRGNSQLRILTPDGMAVIPDLIDRYYDVGHRFRELASKTEEASRLRRSSTLTIAALVTVALVGIGSLAYFLWIDPV